MISDKINIYKPFITDRYIIIIKKTLKNIWNKYLCLVTFIVNFYVINNIFTILLFCINLFIGNEQAMYNWNLILFTQCYNLLFYYISRERLCSDSGFLWHTWSMVITLLPVDHLLVTNKNIWPYVSKIFWVVNFVSSHHSLLTYQYQEHSHAAAYPRGLLKYHLKTSMS